MYKKLSAILVLVLLLLAVPVSAASGGTKDEAMALIKKAVIFANVNGNDKLIVELNKNKGEFIDRDLYIVAVFKDGKRLSHPYKKELIGKSLYDSKDIDGKFYGKELMDVALNKGEGWVKYKFTNPTTGKLANKESYIVKAGDLLLFCGVYN